MSSRESILAAIAANKPLSKPMPKGIYTPENGYDVTARFVENATFTGGKVHEVKNSRAVDEYISSNFTGNLRIIRNSTEVVDKDPHLLANVDVTVVHAHLGVAENGALWVTDTLLSHRILPFVTQHLILVVHERDIVPNLQEAYKILNTQHYGFGVFISGPSKTADIEQALVIGAHGARSLAIFIIK